MRYAYPPYGSYPILYLELAMCIDLTQVGAVAPKGVRRDRLLSEQGR